MKGGPRKGAGRPPLTDKKTQVNMKLPPWLIAWMDQQPKSRAVLIEDACRDYYGIGPAQPGKEE